MKRHIAGSYANTSIMHPDVVDGIQERVRAFLKRCEEPGKAVIDVYVGTTNYMFCASKLIHLDLSALFCHGLRIVSSVTSAWN